MSVQIATSASGLAISNFFASTQNYPFTICGYFKIVSFPGTNTARTVIRLIDTGRSNYIEHQFEVEAGTPKFKVLSVQSNNFSGANISLSGELPNAWKPCVVVCASQSSRTIYSRLDNGTLVSATDAFNRAFGGANDIELLYSWPTSNYFASYLGIYLSALSVAQVEEYMDTGTVAELTPYAKWDATTDWGAGNITDTGSSGTDLTPQTGWSYSTDNPALSSAVSLDTIPATAFPGETITLGVTGAEAVQGTGSVTINGVAQTIVSWSDTSIDITVVQGDTPYGSGNTITLTTDSGDTDSGVIELVANTAGGFGFVNMSSPNTTDESSVAFGATPTVVTGDQFEWEDFNTLGNLVIDAEGFVSSVDTEGTFRGRFWDATDSTWGATETFTAEVPGTYPFSKGIKYAANQNWEWGSRHPMTNMRVRIYK